MPETRPRGYADETGSGRTRTTGRAQLGEGAAAKVERLAANLAAQGRSAATTATSRPAQLFIEGGATGLANAQSCDIDLPDGHLFHIAVLPRWEAVDREFNFGVEAGSGVIPDGRPRPTFMQLTTQITFGGAELLDQRLGGRAYGVEGAYVYGVTGIAWSSFRVRCVANAPAGFPDITYDLTVRARWLRRLYNGQ